jgi:hypothetical protein
MRFVHKIRSLERESVFRDGSEKRLFWRSSAIGLRHLAIWVQVFGIVGWMLSRVFTNPGATFDRTYTAIAFIGMLIGAATTHFARHAWLVSIGCFVCAAAVAFGFHNNASGSLDPDFWVLPMGILMTVGMAPVFADYYGYLASALLLSGSSFRTAGLDSSPIRQTRAGSFCLSSRAARWACCSTSFSCGKGKEPSSFKESWSSWRSKIR